MHVRLRLQMAEVLGPDNRWYCSQTHGRPVEDPETLWIYFIRSGGAADFARRYADAMSAANRWFCSEHFGYQVDDPELLWHYYMRHAAGVMSGRPLRANANQAELSMAG